MVEEEEEEEGEGSRASAVNPIAIRLSVKSSEPKVPYLAAARAQEGTRKPRNLSLWDTNARASKQCCLRESRRLHELPGRSRGRESVVPSGVL